jgi:dTDP-4-amino-4,6-dideoxygalactose transaminase
MDERVTSHSYYLYPLRLNRQRYPGLDKTTLVRALEAEGIPVAEGYPHPLYAQPVFAHYEHRRGDCRAAEQMCQEVCWASHELMLAQPHDLADVVAALAKVSEGAAELGRAATV